VRALAVVRALIFAAYPAAVYLGVSRLGPRELGLVLLALMLPNLALRLASAPPARRWAVLRLPLATSGLVALGAALADPRFFQALPVLINLALLAGFATSLRGPVSMVEHFARLQEPELPEGGPAYCRRVTVAWCWFFAANAAASAALALWAPIAWWALYTGALAYILVGLGFAVEYVVRARTFRRFGDSWHGRLLARILRARPPSDPRPA
jgi:uncharacterized membrane protein